MTMAIDVYQDFKQLLQDIEKRLSQEKPVQDHVEELSAKYTLAYELYAQGNYHEATFRFFELVTLDPWQEDYWKGLAAAAQGKREYELAIHAYAFAALLNDNDPTPHFHAAQCLKNQGQTGEMLKALSAAEMRLRKQAQLYPGLMQAIQRTRQINYE